MGHKHIQTSLFLIYLFTQTSTHFTTSATFPRAFAQNAQWKFSFRLLLAAWKICPTHKLVFAFFFHNCHCSYNLYNMEYLHLFGTNT